jgi:hypothetical protein
MTARLRPLLIADWKWLASGWTRDGDDLFTLAAGRASP